MKTFGQCWKHLYDSQPFCDAPSTWKFPEVEINCMCLIQGCSKYSHEPAAPAPPGNLQKCSFADPTHDPWSLKLWGLGPAIWVLTKPSVGLMHSKDWEPLVHSQDSKQLLHKSSLKICDLCQHHCDSPDYQIRACKQIPLNKEDGLLYLSHCEPRTTSCVLRTLVSTNTTNSIHQQRGLLAPSLLISMLTSVTPYIYLPQFSSLVSLPNPSATFFCTNICRVEYDSLLHKRSIYAHTINTIIDLAVLYAGFWARSILIVVNQ